jgi:hypothetical protein
MYPNMSEDDDDVPIGDIEAPHPPMPPPTQCPVRDPSSRKNRSKTTVLTDDEPSSPGYYLFLSLSIISFPSSFHSQTKIALVLSLQVLFPHLSQSFVRTLPLSSFISVHHLPLLLSSSSSPFSPSPRRHASSSYAFLSSSTFSTHTHRHAVPGTSTPDVIITPPTQPAVPATLTPDVIVPPPTQHPAPPPPRASSSRKTRKTSVKSTPTLSQTLKPPARSTGRAV